VAQTQLNPHDIVYARWHGDMQFELIEKVELSFPHWKCKSLMTDSDFWLLPQIHLSTKNIQMLAGDHNRKQLSISL
jgi:hypothetical protein